MWWLEFSSPSYATMPRNKSEPVVTGSGLSLGSLECTSQCLLPDSIPYSWLRQITNTDHFFDLGCHLNPRGEYFLLTCSSSSRGMKTYPSFAVSTLAPSFWEYSPNAEHLYSSLLYVNPIDIHNCRPPAMVRWMRSGGRCNAGSLLDLPLDVWYSPVLSLHYWFNP